MKKTELLTRIGLLIIVLASLVAIVLQIINERTNGVETLYEIITFSVSISALAMALLASLDNAKNSREINKMAKEIRLSVHELQDINRDDDEIMRQLSESNKLDREIHAILTDQEIGAADERRELASRIGARIRKNSP